MGVSIELRGADEAILRLETLDARLAADPKPLFGEIQTEWINVFRENFLANQSIWPALSPVTIAERVAAGSPPEPKMVRSGHLRESIGLLGMTNDTLRIGTDKVHARLLHFGGRTSPRSRYPNRPVPARPFVHLTREAIEDTMGMIRAFYFDEKSPLDA